MEQQLSKKKTFYLITQKITLLLFLMIISGILFPGMAEAAVLSTLNARSSILKEKAPVLTSETVTKPALAWNNIGSKYTYRI